MFRIQEESLPPLKLIHSEFDGTSLLLEIESLADRGVVVGWGNAAALVTDDFAARFPVMGSDRLLRLIESIVSSSRLKLSISDFLGDLEGWLDLFESPRPGWLGDLHLTAGEPRFELELDGSLDRLEGLLKVVYPGIPPQDLHGSMSSFAGLPRLDDQGRLLTRNFGAEGVARRELAAMGFSSNSGSARYQLQGRAGVLDCIADGLHRISKHWTVRKSARLEEAIRRVHIVRPELKESAGSLGSLSFDLSFQTTNGKSIPAAELRKLLRGGRRALKLRDGSELVVSRTCEELVNPLLEEMGIARLDGPLALQGAHSILFQNLRDILHGELISSSLNHPLSAKSCSDLRLGSNVCLRPYQMGGVEWIVDRLSRLGGALLADEMGLGKTLQTIASICHIKQAESTSFGQALVVAPTSLLGNWMLELKRFAPELRCLLFHGVDRGRYRERLSEFDLIVTSYGTLARDLAFHLGNDYRMVVIDEASLIRNPNSEISRAVCKLRSRGRLALTGTPMENRPRDLWSIFRFVSPTYLGALSDFNERYEAPLADASGAGLRGGVSPLLERLRLRVSPFVLRRTKDQVAKDLPDKVEIDEWLDLPAEQAELYAGVARSGLQEIERIREKQGEGAGRIHLLTLLLRLRQICVDPGLLAVDDSNPESVKINRLIDLLSERFEMGRKTLVFSQFSQNLRRIEKRIGVRYGRVFCIDGSTRGRQGLVDAFQVESGPAVFLISLKAGGYGLNLTAADAVVHLDPWWNPAVEAQATDRAHRIGQDRPVTVYRLLTRGTVEERVRRMQDRKRALIDAATGARDDLPRNWTTQDLEDLLR
ncbi:MAG: DEAD/DEAH box helicase [Verrucomicrobia bacterium]|nr:MAG: DEAD/DEAH box helicase [Verrucomicrobiota bacterium]